MARPRRAMLRLGTLAQTAVLLLAVGAPVAAQQISKPAPPRPVSAASATDPVTKSVDAAAVSGSAKAAADAPTVSAAPVAAASAGAAAAGGAAADEGAAVGAEQGDGSGPAGLDGTAAKAETEAAPLLQQRVVVRFFGGEAEYRAPLRGEQQIDYIVNAKANERLHVDVISETGDIVFEIFKDERRLWSPEQGTVFGGALPEDGPWTIRLSGIDAQTDSAFRLYLGLDAAAAPEPAAQELTAEAVIDAAPQSAPEVDLADLLLEKPAEQAIVKADGAAIGAQGDGAGTGTVSPAMETKAVPPEQGVQLAQADSSTSTDAPPLVLKVDDQPPSVPLLPVPDVPPFGSAASDTEVTPPAAAGARTDRPEPEPAQSEAPTPAAADASAPEAAAVPAEQAAAPAEPGPATPDVAPAAAAPESGQGKPPETAGPGATIPEGAAIGNADTGAAGAEPSEAPAPTVASPPEAALSAGAAAPSRESGAPSSAAAPSPEAALPAGSAAPSPDAGAPAGAGAPLPQAVAPAGAATTPPEAAASASAQVYYLAANLDGAMLNLRRGPARSEPVVAQAGEGSLLVGTECQMGGDLRWCRVTAVEDAAIWGWAAAQFLTVTSAPSPVPTGQ